MITVCEFYFFRSQKGIDQRQADRQAETKKARVCNLRLSDWGCRAKEGVERKEWDRRDKYAGQMAYLDQMRPEDVQQRLVKWQNKACGCVKKQRKMELSSLQVYQNREAQLEAVALIAIRYLS